MSDKKIERIAGDIVTNLEREGLTLNEAVKVVMKADAVIRGRRTAMCAKLGSVPLRNILKGTEKTD